jgi:DNA-binding transcriptional LysR family regulator
VRIVFRSNSLPALVAAALAGRGLVALGLSWATNPGLRLVLPLEELPRRPLWLVTRAEDTGREAVRVVSERIAAILGRAFSSGR